MERIGEVRVIGQTGVRHVEPVYRVDEELTDREQRERVLRDVELRIAKIDEVLEVYDARGRIVYKVT
tara:strand:- start:351 stop:551 length:201 start_codon:yes stop_codon:yes gene_type:complete